MNTCPYMNRARNLMDRATARRKRADAEPNSVVADQMRDVADEEEEEARQNVAKSVAEMTRRAAA